MSEKCVICGSSNALDTPFSHMMQCGCRWSGFHTARPRRSTPLDDFEAPLSLEERIKRADDQLYEQEQIPYALRATAAD